MNRLLSFAYKGLARLSTVALVATVGVVGLGAPIYLLQSPAPTGKPHVAAPLSSSNINPIDASRRPSTVSAAPDTVWSTAGVSGGIPTNYTQCVTSQCNAVSGGTVTFASLTSAISSAPANTYLQIPSGTYNISAGLDIADKSNFILRGNGPNLTTLNFNGTATGCVYDAAICVRSSSSINPEAPSVVANWTAGYSKGTTSITLSSKSGLAVGKLIYLDQLVDGTPDNGEIWMNSNVGVTASEGDSHINRNDGVITYASNRSQVQVVEVTSIPGTACPCAIGINPPLMMPNWRSSQTPQAWWTGSSSTPKFVGIEAMTVDNNTGNGTSANIAFGDVKDMWTKNVRTLHGNRSHVNLYGTLHITYRDSYLFGNTTGGELSYGWETNLSTSYLVENNICHHLQSCMTMGEGNTGNVFGYNFAIDSYYICSSSSPCPQWMQASSYNHTVAIVLTLFEGNDGIGFTADNIHGPAFFTTGFRNRWQGYDPEGGSVGGKSSQTVAVHIYAFNRFYNMVGNVLGDNRRPHTAYQNFPALGSTVGPSADKDVSIYQLGWSGDGRKDVDTGTIINDLLVKSTLLRWGNWDTVTSTSDTSSNDTTGVRWCGNSSNTAWSTTCSSTSEVPTGLALYANTVPSTETLPNSLYLSAKPSWMGTDAWPAIGPDVTSGTVTNTGGHVKQIPARRCFYDVMGGVGNESSPLTFNATSCYS